MMTTAEKYRAAIQVLQQERDVVAGIRNPNDADLLALYDSQIASARKALEEETQ